MFKKGKPERPAAIVKAGLSRERSQFNITAMPTEGVVAPSRPDATIAESRPDVSLPGEHVGYQIHALHTFQGNLPIGPIVADERLKLFK